MSRQRSANRQSAAPIARASASRSSRPRDIGLAAVAAALELPIVGFEPELKASIERGARLIGRMSSRLAA